MKVTGYSRQPKTVTVHPVPVTVHLPVYHVALRAVSALQTAPCPLTESPSVFTTLQQLRMQTPFIYSPK